jgi:hypothetical protein
MPGRCVISRTARSPAAARRSSVSAAAVSSVEWPRTLVRGLIAGIGEPSVVVRLGYLPDSPPPPPTARRDPRDVITIVEQ